MKFENGRIYIVKFIEWHAYVGRVYLEGPFLRITHPRCFRDWGTTKGLGELYKGPTGSTALDPATEQNIPMTSVVCLMEVDQAGWAKKLPKNECGTD